MDNYQYERELYQKGINYIGGIDEVGRGPLIGPVVAACVVLPKDLYIEGLTDSKKLSELDWININGIKFKREK